MASETSYQVAALKAATYRLTSTTVEQLPSLVPHICAQLASCKDVLSLETDGPSKGDGDLSGLVHKLKTRISSLLQHRSSEGRWAAAVLAKTAVECGGHAILQDSLPWVRGLLGNLNRNDPPTTKKLTVIALTKLFVLTRDHQTLVREITTPNLPPFVAACLQLLNASPQLAYTIFNALSQLVSRHPTIFRSYSNQLRPLLLRYIAPVSSQPQETGAAREAAERLYIQLHECAPKNAAAAEWESGLKQTVTCVHETLDQVYRSVLEDWEPAAGYHPIQHSVQALNSEPARFEKDALGLDTWAGLYQGSQRLIGLLALLRSYLITSTTFPATLSISKVFDLLRRILSLSRPSSLREWEVTGRADTRLERREREELAMLLPSIHVAAVRLVRALLQRADLSLKTIAAQILGHLVWVFDSEKSDIALREAVFDSTRDIVEAVGVGLSEESVESISTIATACCGDLLIKQSAPSHKDLLTNGTTHGTSTSAPQPRSSSLGSHHTTAVYAAASALLPVLLAILPADLVPSAVRAEMDRVAVLTRHKGALAASVQNPSVRHQSLLPLLARIYPNDGDVQFLLRPRMPIIAHTYQSQEDLPDATDGDDVSVNAMSQAQKLAIIDHAMSDTFVPSQPNLNHLFPADLPEHVAGMQSQDGVLGISQRSTIPSSHVSSAVSAPIKRSIGAEKTEIALKRQRVNEPEAAATSTLR